MTAPTQYIVKTNLSLTTPYGICVDNDRGRTIIADTGADRLVIVDVVGLKSITNISNYTVSGSIKTISSPYDVCYHDGYYYFTDGGNHALVRLNADDLTYAGHFGTIGTSGSTTSLLDTPIGVCHNKEYVFVVDSGNNRVMKLTLSTLAYDSNGSSFNSVTLSGAKGIAYAKSGDKSLYICDQGNAKIVKCSTSFSYIGAISTVDPYMVCVIGDLIHFTDDTDNSVYAYDTASLTLRETLTATTNALSGPRGIDYYNDAILIVDTTTGYVHGWRRYNPRDALTQSSKMKFGGKFYDQPMIIIDEDTLTAGTTQEYGSVNRWKEENSLCEIGWVGE